MSFIESLSQPIWQRLGLTLVHFLWQGLTVVLLVSMFVRLFRLRSSNSRHAAYLLSFIVMMACPVVTFTAMDVTVESYTGPFVTEAESVDLFSTTPQVVLPPNDILPDADISFTMTSKPAATIDSIPLHDRISDYLNMSLPWLLVIWIVGVLILSVRLVIGFFGVYRWCHHLEQLPERLGQRIVSLSKGLGMQGFSRVFVSPAVWQVMAVGYLRPMVLLPAALVIQMQPEMLEAIIAHELAHIRRFDLWINLLQRITETLFFYHPAVWWLSNRLRNERELCCDELAIKTTGERLTYAAALESVVQAKLIAKQPTLAVGLSQDNKPILRRVRHILGLAPAHRNCPFWLAGVITVMFLTALVISTTFALTAKTRSVTNSEKLTTAENGNAYAANRKIEHSAKFLLDKMLEHRSKVRNLQYVAENNVWEDPAAREVAIEDHIKKMREGGTPERQLERWRRDMNRVPESRYQILKCTIDNAERVKIELTSWTYDSSGKKVPSGDKLVWAWNGVSATDFSQRSGSLGSATIKDTPQIATSLGHPWRSFTGILCQFLEETIAAERQVSVDELKDGTYRIAFDYKTSRIVAVIDPSQGYTCALRENYNDKGQLTSRNTAKYEEVAEGIWFPVSGQREGYTPDGLLRRKSTVESSQIRINDPAFNESYFDVNMPKRARVRDYTRNAERPEIYRYGEPRKSYDEIVQSQSKFVAGLAIDESGSPVPGVAVEVCGHKKPRADGRFSWMFSGSFGIFNAVTDSQGRFAIELEEDGFYNLRFSPENHAAIMAYHVPVGKKDLKITLPEGGTISGRVVRVEDGRKVPIPSVEVKAEQSDRSTYNHLGFNRDRKTLTDSQGRFQFNHLRTKMRSPETRNSEQWEYSPRAWKISHENAVRTVAFYEGTKIEDVELVVEPDYANPISLIGKPLPRFENIKIDFSPKQAKDRKVLVCFWDMNQRPSRNCIIELTKRAKELEEKGVAIIAIQASEINENKLDEWAKNYNIPFPVGMIEGGEEQTRFNWGVKSLPWLILSDRKHVVRAEDFGVNELNEKIKEAGNAKQ